ncbi:MAG TPA: outer-membrane lipoprotein carrier protein LolA [Rhizomicrobium sp.]|jgi:outer membrane lipoprotein-sorting protein|nr:outer-membrane lipoprotein carrier protein LolA [Rhizomicrobium sp.]
MRRIALALAAVLLAAPAAAAGLFVSSASAADNGNSIFPGLRHVELSSKDRDELDAISAYLNSIVTLKGGFLQVEPNGNIAEGTVYISKPGKMRFEYKPPVPTLVVSDGSTVAVANTRLGTVDKYPLFETPLSLILGKTIDLRHSPNLVSVEHQGGQFLVHLRGNQKHTKANITLTFAEPQYELLQWTVVDEQGLTTTVALRNLTPGAALAPSLFVLPDKSAAPRRGN